MRPNAVQNGGRAVRANLRGYLVASPYQVDTEHGEGRLPADGPDLSGFAHGYGFDARQDAARYAGGPIDPAEGLWIKQAPARLLRPCFPKDVFAMPPG